MQVGNHENTDQIHKLDFKRKPTSICVNDALCDSIARIKNAYNRQHMEHAFVIKTKFVKNVLNKLFLEGYIGEITEEGQELKVGLLKNKKGNGIDFIKVKTKPGRRVYVSYEHIPRSKFGVMGQFFLSTNKGILTDKEAKEQKIGGELLLEVYSCQRLLKKQ